MGWRAAALLPVTRQVGDGVAMGGFSRVGRSGGAPWRGAEARVSGSRRAAACRQRHGSRTGAEILRTRKNEESISFRR